jgi:hypothetical protein
VVDYSYTRETVADMLTATQQTPNIRWEHRTGLRNAYRVGWRFRHVSFSSAPSFSVGEKARETFQVVTAGWTHSITTLAQVELEAGPHFTGRDIRPEISTTVRQRLEGGELTVSYSRTQATTMGETGTIDLNRLAATGTFRPTPRFTLSIAPALARSARDGRQVGAYTLNFDGVLNATHRTSVMVSGQIGRQDGTLSGWSEPIAYRSLALRVLISLPRTAGRTETGE